MRPNHLVKLARDLKHEFLGPQMVVNSKGNPPAISGKSGWRWNIIFWPEWYNIDQLFILDISGKYVEDLWQLSGSWHNMTYLNVLNCWAGNQLFAKTRSNITKNQPMAMSWQAVSSDLFESEEPRLHVGQTAIPSKNWMGPYQWTPKLRSSYTQGSGVRSVGPVGDFLELWEIPRI